MARKKSRKRLDGAYENIFASVGGVADRSRYTRIRPERLLSDKELEDLYVYDGMARRIVDLPSEEMMRSGFYIEGVESEEKIRSYLEERHFTKKVTEALKWASLYGGSIIVMLINDGGSFTDELDYSSIKDIEQFRVYDKTEISWSERYDDPSDKRFGKIRIYTISPHTGIPYDVHESRCLIFDGASAPNAVREQRENWGMSVLQQCYNNLLKYGMAQEWANSLLERAQQAVHAIPNLTALLRSPDGEDLIKKRINIVDMTRSINNTIVIDEQESYELKSTPFAGIADIIDRLGLSLTCVTGMPECLFFGRQQGGLNGNGNADLENWYAKMTQQRETELYPIVTDATRIALFANGIKTDFRIRFNPMYLPSDKEIAETNWRDAQTFAIYSEMGAMDKTEIRAILPSKGFLIDPSIIPEGGNNENPSDLITNRTASGKQKTKGPLISTKR